MSKLVSIIIPTYNSADFISETVRSAFNQNYTSLEVIVVDNNSTDNTWEILEELKDEFPSMILAKETKQNACAARNKGLTLSRGEWLQFLDSDDILLPNKISNQMAVLEDMPADTPFLVGTYLRKDLIKNVEQQIDAIYDPWKGIIYNRLGQTTTNLFNRSALTEVGGWNDDLKSSQEYDLMFRMLRRNDNIARCSQVDTIVQAREGSINTSDVLGNQHRYLHLIARIVDYLSSSKKEIYNQIDEEFFQKMFVRIRLSAINGFPDYAYFYDKIMPKDVVVSDNKFTPKWFSTMSRVVGYKTTENFRQFLRKVPANRGG
ncbi:MAG: glycosyltransferase involved in cell wall biosynthesis [Patiriisocius sp.]|jgi:glycosyltransferase involved in cell wall biosynthesis